MESLCSSIDDTGAGIVSEALFESSLQEDLPQPFPLSALIPPSSPPQHEFIGDASQRSGSMSSLLSLRSLVKELSNNGQPTRAAMHHPSRTSSFSSVSSKTSSMPMTKLLIDKAYAMAFDSLSSMEFRESEIFKILRSLKYQKIVEPAQKFDSIDRRNKILLPFRNPHALAATLTNYVRNHIIVEGQHFSVSEKKALLAVRNLTNLVRGDFASVRKFLLQRLRSRPSHLTHNEVKDFLQSLQLPSDKFDLRDGNELLSIDGKCLADTFQVASVLQYRFLVYQNMLRIIDAWWDQGRRPEDQWDEDLPAEPAAFPADFSEGMQVKVCDATTLLAAWLPYNRGLGWGSPLESLTSLSESIGGAEGVLVIPQSRSTHAGCQLVFFGSNQMMLQRLKSFSALPVIGETVYIPTTCLRRLIRTETVGLTSEEAKIGAKVRLPSREILLRSIDHFEWWDRPPLRVL